LNGKVAVVTGARRESAADIAKTVRCRAQPIVVNYASSKEGADRVVDQIASAAAGPLPFGQMWPGRQTSNISLLRLKAFGKIDILVNNAGVYDCSPIEEMTEEQFHKHFDVNVLVCSSPRRKRSSSSILLVATLLMLVRLSRH